MTTTIIPGVPDMTVKEVQESFHVGRQLANTIRDREIDHAKAAGVYLEPFRFPFALRAFLRTTAEPYDRMNRAVKLARYPVTREAAAAYVEKVLNIRYDQ